jgi:hypothetical protein
LAVVSGVCIYFVLASQVAGQIDLAVQRLNAVEAEYPIHLLSQTWFRWWICSAIPVSLGSACAAVVVGGVVAIQNARSQIWRAHAPMDVPDFGN